MLIVIALQPVLVLLLIYFMNSVCVWLSSQSAHRLRRGEAQPVA